MSTKRKDETQEEFNARANEYMKARYRRRRNTAIERLGGICVDCGSSQRLEFDHVDPSLKEFNIGQCFTSMSKERLDQEVDKCVLRCIGCHSTRTAVQKIGNADLLGDLLNGLY